MHVNKHSLLLVLRPGLKPGEDEHQQSAMRTRKGWEPLWSIWVLLCRAGSYSDSPATSTDSVQRV